MVSNKIHNMRKIIVSVCLFLVIVGCHSDPNTSKDIEILTRERDSLKALIDTLNTKYIFDEASLTTIPILWKKHHKGEIVAMVGYVAFNKNDRILFSTESDFSVVDTLRGIDHFEFKIKRSDADTVYYKLVNKPKFGREIDYTVSDPLKNYP